MQKMNKIGAQGDVVFLRVGKLPENIKPHAIESGKYIVAHSETGYHHVIEASETVRFYTTDDPLVSYLEVIEATEEAETVLEHLRSYHTHEAWCFGPGIYEFRRQKEASSRPEGWQVARD